MAFFTRLSTGWDLAKASLKVLRAHKELIVFPLLSGLSILLVLASFGIALLRSHGWDFDQLTDISRGAQYFVAFVFYIINYFVVVFFNMALMHCAKLYFDGQEVSVAKGLQFSVSRLGAIFSWAIFAATVGVILKVIQDNLGTLGKILTGLLGMAWGITTFFVVPIIAYENLGPLDAVKRSAVIMKDNWGDSLVAQFSIGLVGLVAFALFGVAGAIVAAAISEAIGIAIFVAGLILVLLVSSALNSIFISAMYNHVNGNSNDHFDKTMLDNLFVEG
jgi:Family of unknown function (DUF6159)